MVDIGDIFRSQEDTLSNLWDRAIEMGLVNRRFDQSRIGLLFAIFAGEFQNLISIVSQYTTQFSLETVTDPALLESMVKPFTNRRMSNNAKAMLKATRLQGFNEDFILPAGFKITTIESGPIYETAADLYVRKGIKNSQVLAFATEPGSRFNVDANKLVEFENEDDAVFKISITNPHPSWGGRDDENLEDTRNRALNWRYDRDGTSTSIQYQLDELNVLYRDRNIVEYWAGDGSVLLALDIDNPYEFEDVADALELQKVDGISYHIMRAKRIYLDLIINLTISGRSDLNINEKHQLYDDTDNEVREFFGMGLGVGSDFSINHLQVALSRTLSQFYDILDVNVKVSNEDLYIDNRKIKIQPTETFYPNKVTILINYEGN